MTTTTREYLDEQECRQAGVLPAYRRMRKRGVSSSMAAMLALKRPAASPGGERGFQKRSRERMNGYAPSHLENITDIAKKAGIDTAGKVYVGGLGKYNDPRAWVSDTSDIRRVAEERGLEIDGAIKIKGREVPPPKQVPLAEDLVQKQMAKYVKADPKLAENVKRSSKARAELRERVIEKHTPRRKKQ